MFNDEEAGDAEDNWMDTYADAITLLMAFFCRLARNVFHGQKKYDHMRDALSEGVNQNPLEQVASAFEEKG